MRSEVRDSERHPGFKAMADYDSVRSDWWALLDWHLIRGTRPHLDFGPDKAGKQWKDDEFAEACNVGDPHEPRYGARTVLNWHQRDINKKQVVPHDLTPIEEALLGRNKSYDLPHCTWRSDLRVAHAVAKTKQRKPLGDPDSNITIRVPTHFRGRDNELSTIQLALSNQPQSQPARVAIYGMRGVGKTVVAIAYADRYGSKCRATWWIKAQTEMTMRADLIALGVRLGWVRLNDKEELALYNVMKRLERDGKHILLIYDNAYDDKTLKPYLPRTGSARVIITSNAHAWHDITPAVIEIKVWPKHIGGDFLIARSGRSDALADAEALSEALEGLPLAHEMAGAYCSHREKSIAAYHKLFEATPLGFLADERFAPVEYGRTVAKTFTLAIDEVAKVHSGAEPFIVHAAFLALGPIPLFLFSEARAKLGEPLSSMLADNGLDEAVAALRAFALVDRDTIMNELDQAVTTDAIRLHRLVREIAAMRRQGEARDQLRSRLAAALLAVYPDGGYRNPASWGRCASLTPHLLAICEMEAADDSTSLKRARLLLRAADYFHGRSAYSVARPLYERALTIHEKTLSPEHPDTAGILNSLALVLEGQGDFSAARALYERVLAVAEQVLGPEHLNTAGVLGNLAHLFQAQGDLAKARGLYERAWTIAEKALGPQHPETAKSLNNLANIFQAQGDLARARPLYERALTIREKALGDEHPDTAQSFNNLASLLQAQGDLAGARPLCERALSMREKVLGPEHIETVGSLNNLAELLRAQDDLAAARPLLERALAIARKMLGPEHPLTAKSMNNLAGLLKHQGDFAAARPLLERALAIRETALGSEHPDTAESLNSLAGLLRAQGDLTRARSLYERALAIRERVLGSDHPDTATSLSNLAVLLGDRAEVRPLLERALAIREKVLGSDHPDTAISLNNLAVFVAHQGDLAAALRLFERALPILRKVLGAKHQTTLSIQTSLVNLHRLMERETSPTLGEQRRNPQNSPTWEEDVPPNEWCPCGSGKRYGDCHGSLIFRDDLGEASGLSDLAFFLQARGDLARARPLFERALAIYEKVLGPEHPETATSLNNLACLLRAQDNFTGARPLFERALAIREKVLGPDHPDTAMGLNNLASSLENQGDLTGARRLWERALAIYEKVLGPEHSETVIVRDNLARSESR